MPMDFRKARSFVRMAVFYFEVGAFLCRVTEKLKEL